MADAFEKEVDTGGLKQTFKDLFSGAAGGVAQVSVQFGGFHYARRQFEAQNILKGKPSDLSYTQLYLSGAFAGLANSFLSGPIEHVRIRLQTQPHGAGRLYNGPVDCVRKLVQQGGGIGGVYRGQAVTVAREGMAYGVWFLTFEYLMRQHSDRTSTPRSSIPAPIIALYGGLAGETLWLSSYPFDVIKSKIQSDGFTVAKSGVGAELNEKAAREGQVRRYRNMRDCFAQTWREEGARGFWKGIGPTCVRALP
ncbi:MAG: hypothetical protein Q9200_005330, partial [Gallowayella weberi]